MSDAPLLAALIGLRDRLDAVADEFREEIGELRGEVRELRAEMSARFDRIEEDDALARRTRRVHRAHRRGGGG